MDAVSGASGRPTEAFAWIAEVEDQKLTLEHFANPGDFDSLDAKLAKALCVVATGELERCRRRGFARRRLLASSEGAKF